MAVAYRKRLWVVPHAGTWIEIVVVAVLVELASGRSPRGNVD